LVGVDRTETVGLFQRNDLTTGDYVWSVGSLSGAGPVKDVARISFFTFGQVELTGDGKSVIVDDGTSTKRVTIATGASTVVSPQPLFPAVTYGQSDDGQVVGGTVVDADGNPSGVIYVGTKKVTVPGWPWIAPDGRSASWLGGPSGTQTSPALYTLNLVTGKTTSSPLPTPVDESYLITWVSTDGSKVVVADTGAGGDTFAKPAKLLDRTTGRWSTFGGQISGWIKSAHNHTAISRNGQFAAIAYNGQVALVNLSGGPLLGNLLGLEAVSASSYIASPFGLFQSCGDSAYSSGQFERPADWIAAPKKAQVTVSADGTVIKQQTLVKTESGPYANDGDQFFANFPAGTTTGTVKISVVDGAGRTVTETFSKKVSCS
ncbi:MAG: hypothetical protein AAGC46_04465, partial [Solirubrobacteraceae bacterium]